MSLKFLRYFFLYIIVLLLIFVAVFFTVKSENNRWKNTILFVMDEGFYNITYEHQKDKIDKILDQNYTKLVTQVYKLNEFTYDSFIRDLRSLDEMYAPTHIVLSPTIVIYLFSYNAEKDIAFHSRGRAKIIGLTRVTKEGSLDEFYRIQDVNTTWNQIGVLADSQTLSTAFVYNSSDSYSQDAYLAFSRNTTKDHLIIDEYPRNEGEEETNEIYTKLFVENDTKIIITPYFKNLSLLQNRLERENKDVLFILDAEMTISLGDNGIKNLAAVNNLALDEIFEDLITNPSFSSLDVTFEKKGSRYIYILNDDIIVPEGDAFIK